jgi:hypothetical protein
MSKWDAWVLTSDCAEIFRPRQCWRKTLAEYEDGEARIDTIVPEMLGELGDADDRRSRMRSDFQDCTVRCR